MNKKGLTDLFAISRFECIIHIHILPTNILTFLKKQEGSTLKQYFQKKSAYISIDKCSLHDSIMFDFRLYIYLTGIYNLEIR